MKMKVHDVAMGLEFRRLLFQSLVFGTEQGDRGRKQPGVFQIADHGFRLALTRKRGLSQGGHRQLSGAVCAVQKLRSEERRVGSERMAGKSDKHDIMTEHATKGG